MDEITSSDTGSQNFVLGLLPPGDGSVSADYSIDGGPPESKVLETLVNESLSLGNSSYFSLPPLSPGNHNLTITVTDTGRGRNYTLDFFDVLSLSTKSNDKLPSSGGSGTRNPDARVIAAGVLSAVALMVILAFGLRWIRRRRTRSASETQINEEKDVKSDMATEIGRYCHG